MAKNTPEALESVEGVFGGASIGSEEPFMIPPSLREGSTWVEGEDDSAFFELNGLARLENQSRKESVSEEEVEEEVSEEEAAEEEEVETLVFSVEDLGTEPPRPSHTYEQAYEHYRTHAIAHSLRASGFAVAEDLSDLHDVMNKAAKEDPAGMERVYRHAETVAKQGAEQYHDTQIQPYTSYQTQKQIIKFLGEMQEDLPDLARVYPVMDEIKDEFFRKHPKLLHNPVQALPWLYTAAKDHMKKNPPAEGEEPKKGKTQKMETGGKRSMRKGRTESKDPRTQIDFSKMLNRPSDMLGIWG